MRKYIGVKIVEAVAMTLSEHEGPTATPGDLDPSAAGYRVRYPDGYLSWCPAAAFEEANRSTDGMTFGHAIEAARKGHKIARAGWDGKGMTVFVRSACQTVLEDIGSPKAIQQQAHFCMITVQGELVVGWLASQTDMLADDWQIVE